MPEMSFGRSIRYRRTRLGLSQARLGQLVGRSGAAIRSWERDASIPTDVSVLQALSAVLGIETEVLFEKAGVEVPAVETSPTVEEVLGTLTPVEAEKLVQVPSRVEESPDEIETPAPDEFEAFSLDDPPEEIDDDRTADLPTEDPPEPVTVGAAPLPVSKPSNRGSFALSQPTEPRYRYTTPAPPVLEPTYMDDQSQRQLYRVRHLATLVLVVALIVLFVWALGNSVEAFSSWWEDFFGTFQF
ncbi:MAG TPA: helix-turn-helix domain-containing protein [Acidimicrobiia bacterium]|nr:helix-turn-helix domain-containing protein [Acidimicrobiia bacterium]